MNKINENKDERRRKYIPKIESKLRDRIIKVPEAIYEASGIEVYGKRIKSLLFTTDIAVIRNNNANAIMAVYPFTPLHTIIQSILEVSPVPVFAGVGGGTTTGLRSVDIAVNADLMGVYGVIVNAPTKPVVIESIARHVDCPVIATISGLKDDYMAKVDAGARILNISAAANTADVVAKVRSDVGEEFPIIATGGPNEETILQTIKAGANAITYTPPSSDEIFAQVMAKYREEIDKD